MEPDISTEVVGAPAAEAAATPSPTPAPSPEGSTTSTTPDSTPAPASTEGETPAESIGNLFDDYRERAAARRHAPALPSPTQPAQAPNGAPSSAQDEAPGATAGAPAEEAPSPEQEPPRSAASRRFQVLDADGKDVTATLPTGAQVTLKAGGREHALPLEKLVEHASMGIYANQRLQEMGQARAAAERTAASLQREMEAVQGQRDALASDFDDLIGRILTDPETFDAALAAYERRADPEVRQALAAKRTQDWEEQRASARAEAETQVQDQQQAQVHDQVWTELWTERVPSAIAEHIAGDAYPFLTDTDTHHLTQAFYAQYVGAYTAEAERLSSRGLPPEVVHDLANEQGIRALTEDNLNAALRELNAEREKKIKPRITPRAPDPEIAAARTAELHNNRTQQRMERGNGAVRTIGAGGGGGGAVRADVPQTAPGGADGLSMPDLQEQVEGLFDGLRRRR